MFRKNEAHHQQGPSSSQQLLPKELRQRLEYSWAQTFYDEVFCRIDEEPFAVLYSSQPSRPNAPINVLVGMDTLKAGFGWSDEELYDHVCFDLQVRHALGLNDLSVNLFNIRTVYNRQRLRPEDKPIRAAVEATIRSLKHPFPGGKLPVRGLIRATMVVCCSAMMVNLRRLHAYRQVQTEQKLAA